MSEPTERRARPRAATPKDVTMQHAAVQADQAASAVTSAHPVWGFLGSLLRLLGGALVSGAAAIGVYEAIGAKLDGTLVQLVVFGGLFTAFFIGLFIIAPTRVTTGLKLFVALFAQVFGRIRRGGVEVP